MFEYTQIITQTHRLGHTPMFALLPSRALAAVPTCRDTLPGDCRHSDSPRFKTIKAEQLDLKTETFSHQLSSLYERLRNTFSTNTNDRCVQDFKFLFLQPLN
ncbi:hypothetical protein ILYODFUR_003258 [Ilyodon furcidens]|uniref:Uncharacterized protein n=1 Tax=Ilyodon furcidens TaxID=33524 RepID=A0ABV0T4V1_9TELE